MRKSHYLVGLFILSCSRCLRLSCTTCILFNIVNIVVT
ncbi:hypothetical protein BIZ89_gp218 [Bacillus phage Kida]|nr:hypothetical protein BIZ89_gp218 [Bacillus phage Kida]ANU80082.1 hypothetical protein KIDA_220 [Bacillus phage Kida]